MTKKEVAQIAMASIKLESETCREMLLRGLTELKTLENHGFNLVGRENVADKKPDPKEVHNYNPRDAYGPTKLEKVYSGKPNSHKISH